MELLLTAAAVVPADLAATAAGADASPSSSPAASAPFAPPSTELLDALRAELAGRPGASPVAAVPADVPELLQLVARADVYVQDEVELRHHPTLTRVWSRRGRRGQRRVRAPGWSRKLSIFGAADWRDGWVSINFARRRSAEHFCQQLDDLVARSQARGRVAIVVCDNANIHTPRGSKLVRATVARHEGWLRLVYTPAYDPEANPSERLWPPYRRAVTHNHHRADFLDLYHDAIDYFTRLDHAPDRVLRQLGSPCAPVRSSTLAAAA